MATASTSSSIVMAWQLPAEDSQNGIIKGFKLFYKHRGSTDSLFTVQLDDPLILTKTVTGLDEFTEYEFQVLAYTAVGDGPKGPVVVVRTERRKEVVRTERRKEDGKR